MNVGDPVTEAACWNAAWRMVTSGALAGADFAGLVARRLGSAEGAAPLPVAGLEVLLERAVTAADLYAPDTERAGARAALAAASLAEGGRRVGRGGGEPAAARAGGRVRGQRAVRRAAGRSRARGWTAGPGRTAWSSTATCAGGCCGRWRPAASPPTRTWTRWPPRTRWPGSRTWSACRAAAAGRRGQGGGLGSWRWPTGQDRRTTEAAARGIWVPGQEAVLAGYREPATSPRRCP